MKSFANVYKASRTEANNIKSMNIDSDRKVIIDTIKSEYGISSFSSISESERTKYKNMLLEYWSPKSGITSAGKDFIAESKQELSPKISDEAVKKIVQKQVRADATNFIYGILSKNTNGQNLSALKAEVEHSIERSISPKDFKNWVFEVLIKHLQSELKSYKF